MARPPKFARAMEDPEWVEWAKVKEKKNLEQWPELKPLQDKLLLLGGDWVALEPECDAEALLNKGRLFKGRITFKRMASHNCHGNCAQLWINKPDTYKIATGWALSNDGIWRQHSWLLKRNAIIETTEPRAMYYGIVLDFEAAANFSCANIR